MLRYKGFVACVEFEPNTHTFLGQIHFGQDLIAFGAQYKKDLPAIMTNAVDNYLSATSIPESIEPEYA